MRPMARGLMLPCVERSDCSLPTGASLPWAQTVGPPPPDALQTLKSKDWSNPVLTGASRPPFGLNLIANAYQPTNGWTLWVLSSVTYDAIALRRNHQAPPWTTRSNRLSPCEGSRARPSASPNTGRWRSMSAET